MLLLVPSEVTLLAPQIASKPAIQDDDAKRGYIQQASTAAEAACNRGQYGFELRDFYDVQVPLSMTLGGVLPADPFLAWIGDEGELDYFGDTSPPVSVALADFSVDRRSGAIRNLSAYPTLRANVDPGWKGAGDSYVSYYSQIRSPYGTHSGEISANDRPYILTCSFTAGFFFERNLMGGAAEGDAVVTLDDLTGLELGQEFYFSSDPDEDLRVDRRYVTAIDTETRAVSFRPALSYDLSGEETLRRVDRAVRVAVAEIIADLLQWPANTKRFQKDLGKRDLFKSWDRNSDLDIPASAMRKLAPYVRL